LDIAGASSKSCYFEVAIGCSGKCKTTTGVGDGVRAGIAQYDDAGATIF
jgi:hypothetical protein